ncbi:ATP synthase F1 subunit epsilon [bacterium]|nr:ATP synthase F1 subunit epsilon [bacterium]
MQVEILTPRGSVLTAESTSVILPLESGYVGVQDNHLPMIGLVVPGAFWLRLGDKVQVRFVSQGIVEVAGNRVLVLTDASEAADDIDLPRAREALERAMDRAAEKGVDRGRARLALNRAKARLSVALGEAVSVVR